MPDVTNRKFRVLAGVVAVLVLAVVAEAVAIFHLWPRGSQHGGREFTGSPGSGASAGSLRHLLPHENDHGELFEGDTDLWNPVEELRRMQERIDRMFGNTFGRLRQSREFGHLFGEFAFSPDINIEDRGDHYLVTVDLPGAENTRVNVKLDGQRLTISGEIESETRDGSTRGRMLREERKTGKFYRSLTLPSAVDGEKMTTTNKDGVLYVKIPKVVS